MGPTDRSLGMVLVVALIWGVIYWAGGFIAEFTHLDEIVPGIMGAIIAFFLSIFMDLDPYYSENMSGEIYYGIRSIWKWLCIIFCGLSIINIDYQKEY